MNLNRMILVIALAFSFGLVSCVDATKDKPLRRARGGKGTEDKGRNGEKIQQDELSEEEEASVNDPKNKEAKDHDKNKELVSEVQKREVVKRIRYQVEETSIIYAEVLKLIREKVNSNMSMTPLAIVNQAIGKLTNSSEVTYRNMGLHILLEEKRKQKDILFRLLVPADEKKSVILRYSKEGDFSEMTKVAEWKWLNKNRVEFRFAPQTLLGLVEYRLVNSMLPETLCVVDMDSQIEGYIKKLDCSNMSFIKDSKTYSTAETFIYERNSDKEMQIKGKVFDDNSMVRDFAIEVPKRSDGKIVYEQVELFDLSPHNEPGRMETVPAQVKSKEFDPKEPQDEITAAEADIEHGETQKDKKPKNKECNESDAECGKEGEKDPPTQGSEPQQEINEKFPVTDSQEETEAKLQFDVSEETLESIKNHKPAEPQAETPPATEEENAAPQAQ